jgi:hypothetical protein
MSTLKSIDQTNELNTPVKGYIAPAKVKSKQGDRTSAPNYRKLSQTPTRMRHDTISGQVHFGQPPKDTKRTANKNFPPPRVSNRPTLSREKGHREPMTPQNKPLRVAKPRAANTTTNRQSSQATSSTQPTRPFRNRFDHPLTERELNQLRLGNLKGKNQKITQELLNKLLTQSKQLAEKLENRQSAIKQESVSPQKVLVKSEPMPPILQKKEPKPKPAAARATILRGELIQAQADARHLEMEYPKYGIPSKFASTPTQNFSSEKRLVLI